MADTAMLLAANLTRRFDDRVAVDDVSFQVAQGETYGLLGPNGAGKTTTIRLVCGLLSADGGDVSVAGMPVSTPSSAHPSRQVPSAQPWASRSGCSVGACGRSRSSPSPCDLQGMPLRMRGRWTPG